jgi:hypothetical protein
MASLVTEALTQEEPQLQVQPGSAKEDVSMDGKKQSDKVRPTHCEETGVCFGSRKASVLLPTRLRFSVVSYGKLAHSLGSGRKNGKVEGLEQFIPQPKCTDLAALLASSNQLDQKPGR